MRPIKIAIIAFACAALLSQAAVAAVKKDDQKAEDFLKKYLEEHAKLSKSKKSALCPFCGKPLKDHIDGKVDCKKGRMIIAPEWKKLTCPVCAFTPKGSTVMSSNAFGGVDSDYCKHPVGLTYGSPVWLCPNCGYAQYTAAFEKAVSNKVKDFCLTKLKKVTIADIRAASCIREKTVSGKPLLPDKDLIRAITQDDIPEILKYENFSHIVTHCKRPPGETAELYLGYSWALRRAFCRPFPGSSPSRKVERMIYDESRTIYAHPVKMRRRVMKILSTRGDELKSDDKFALRFQLAVCYARLGFIDSAIHELDRAHEILKQSDKIAEIDRSIALANEGYKTEDVTKLRAMRKTFTLNRAWLLRTLILKREMLRREQECQRKALRGLLLIVRDKKYVKEKLAKTVYLVGELYRRLKLLHESYTWLEAAKKIAPENSLEKEYAGLQLDLIRTCGVKQGAKDGLKSLDAVLADGLEIKRKIDAENAKKVKAVGKNPDTRVKKPNPKHVVKKGTEAECKKILRALSIKIDQFEIMEGRFPDSLKELVEKKYIKLTSEFNDFKCPVTGDPYQYRKPASRDAAVIMIFTKKKGCTAILFPDGTITNRK